MKPKPLNLDSEEIEELVIHKLKNLDTVFINVDEVPDIRTAIRVTTEEIKQRINSACEFYLKYKDNPELLVDELYYIIDEDSDTYIRLKLEVENWIDKIRESYEDSDVYDKYNEWLFKLAFKDVFEDGKGD